MSLFVYPNVFGSHSVPWCKASPFLMPYCVPGFSAINRTRPYLHKTMVWLWRRQPSGCMTSTVAVQVELAVGSQIAIKQVKVFSQRL